jgi:methanogenic corrinoid protein MtbC1
MTEQQSIPSWFNRGKYAQSADQIRKVKAQLDETAVRSLAAEALHRVVARDAEHGSDGGQQLLALDVDELAHALVDEDADAGLVFITQLQDTGASVERIYLAYLAAAARKLGTWWDEDQISLFDVTTGTGRIYGILRALDDQFSPKASIPGKAALFASVPHETHTLGVRMAADLFQNRGWGIELVSGASHDELMDRIVASDTAIIGLSAAGAHALPHLARLILAIRLQRPSVSIVVSGQIALEARAEVEAMEPDGVATSVPTAINILDGLAQAHTRH